MPILESLAVGIAIQIGFQAIDRFSKISSEKNIPLEAAKEITESNSGTTITQDDLRTAFARTIESENENSYMKSKNELIGSVSRELYNITGEDVKHCENICREYIDRVELKLIQETDKDGEILLRYARELSETQKEFNQDFNQLSRSIERYHNEILSIELSNQGILHLNQSHLENLKIDPEHCWTRPFTFSEINNDFHILRQSSNSSSVEWFHEELLSTLNQETELVLKGPSGAGKTTICKHIAVSWKKLGKNVYWINPHSAKIDTLDFMQKELRSLSEPALIIIDNAGNLPEDVSRSIRDITDYDDVYMLFSIRNKEYDELHQQNLIRETDEAKTITSVFSRFSTITTPAFSVQDCKAFISKYESLTGSKINESASSVFDYIYDTSEVGRGGEMVILSHLVRNQNLTQGPTGLEMDVIGKLEALENPHRNNSRYQFPEEVDSRLIGDMGFCIILLSALDYPVRKEFLHTIDDNVEDVERVIDSFKDWIIFDPSSGSEMEFQNSVNEFETVHSAWSMIFLKKFIDLKSGIYINEKAGRCISKILSVSEKDTRTRLSKVVGETDFLERISSDSQRYVDKLVINLFWYISERPSLAPLVGTVNGPTFAIKELCSGNAVIETLRIWIIIFDRLGEEDLRDEAYNYLAELIEYNLPQASSEEEKKFLMSLLPTNLLSIDDIDEEQELDRQLESLEFSQKYGSDKNEAIDLINISIYYQKLGQYPEARDSLDRARSVLKRINKDTNDIGRVRAALHHEYGLLERSDGNIEDSIHHLQEELDISTSIEDPRGRVHALKELARLVRNRSDLSNEYSSTDLYEKAKEIALEAGDRELAKSCARELPIVYMENGEYSIGKKQAEETLKNFFDEEKSIDRSKLVLCACYCDYQESKNDLSSEDLHKWYKHIVYFVSEGKIGDPIYRTSLRTLWELVGSRSNDQTSWEKTAEVILLWASQVRIIKEMEKKQRNTHSSGLSMYDTIIDESLNYISDQDIQLSPWLGKIHDQLESNNDLNPVVEALDDSGSVKTSIVENIHQIKNFQNPNSSDEEMALYLMHEVMFGSFVNYLLQIDEPVSVIPVEEYSEDQ